MNATLETSPTYYGLTWNYICHNPGIYQYLDDLSIWIVYGPVLQVKDPSTDIMYFTNVMSIDKNGQIHPVRRCPGNSNVVNAFVKYNKSITLHP